MPDQLRHRKKEEQGVCHPRLAGLFTVPASLQKRAHFGRHLAAISSLVSLTFLSKNLVLMALVLGTQLQIGATCMTLTG